MAVAEDASPGLGKGLDNTAENDDVGDDLELGTDPAFETGELVFELLELPKVRFLGVKAGIMGAL